MKRPCVAEIPSTSFRDGCSDHTADGSESVMVRKWPVGPGEGPHGPSLNFPCRREWNPDCRHRDFAPDPPDSR